MEILMTVVVLLVIGVAFLVTYLRYVRGIAVERWMLVLDLLRVRLDKIPNLIETVHRFVPDENFNELVALRGVCWPQDLSGKNKVASELEISDKVGAIWGLVKKNPELGRDTNFLALKMEFKEISAEIEKALEVYNEKVRAYNGNVLFKILSPFAGLFGLDKLFIFEFETKS